MSRKALGKGLEALFGNLGTPVVNPQTGETVMPVDLAAIEPNPYQPRRFFSTEEIEELAQSIEEKGLLQPVLVRKHGEGFQLVAGERRFRAFKSLGRAQIPALVREQVSDRDMMELALIENLQRVQLNPVEEAQALEQLVNQVGLTHEEMAKKLGKSRSAISNTLRLLKLPDPVLDLLKSGRLSAGHGRALLQEDPKNQVKLAQKMVEQHWNVRHAESAGGRKKEKAGPEEKNPHLASFLSRLRQDLGTKVALKGDDRRGVLEIHYFSREELEAIGRVVREGAGAFSRGE